MHNTVPNGTLRQRIGIGLCAPLADAWPAEGRDFLIGNADNFEALNETDLSLLIKALDEAGTQWDQSRPYNAQLTRRTLETTEQ